MKMLRIIMISQLLIILVSCKNSGSEKNYISADTSEFSDLSKSDTILLYNKVYQILDSLDGKSEDSVLKRRLYSEFTKGVGLKHVVLIKLNDEKENILAFYFDENLKFLNYEKR